MTGEEPAKERDRPCWLETATYGVTDMVTCMRVDPAVTDSLVIRLSKSCEG